MAITTGTQTGSGHSSSDSGGISTGTQSESDDSSGDPFSGGYAGNAVVAPDGSLVATGDTQLTQVGSAVDAGPGQITGSADNLQEVKQAVEEQGGNAEDVGVLVENPNVDSEGPVLQKAGLLESFNAGQVEAAFNDAFTGTSAGGTKNNAAGTYGSVTRTRDSPLADGSDAEANDSGVTDSVFSGPGDSDFTITGTTDADGPNTGSATVPGVSDSGSSNSNQSGGINMGLDITSLAGSVIAAVIVGYVVTQMDM